MTLLEAGLLIAGIVVGVIMWKWGEMPEEMKIIIGLICILAGISSLPVILNLLIK
jgi:hypothetical protein